MPSWPLRTQNVLLVTILNHRIFCSIQHSHVFSFGVGLKSSPPLFGIWSLQEMTMNVELGSPLAKRFTRSPWVNLKRISWGVPVPFFFWMAFFFSLFSVGQTKAVFLKSSRESKHNLFMIMENNIPTISSFMFFLWCQATFPVDAPSPRQLKKLWSQQRNDMEEVRDERKPEMHVMELWNSQIVCSLLYVAAPILMNVLMKVLRSYCRTKLWFQAFLIPTLTREMI